MKDRNFPSHNQARMKVYVSLIVFFKKELNILRVAIDVLDFFQLSDVYQMKMHDNPQSG